MNDEMSAVMTVYLRDNKLEKFKISYHNRDNADFYCKAINDLNIEGELKVVAKVIKADRGYTLDKFFKLPFDILIYLDDRAIQKTLREVDSKDAALALKITSKEVQDKIFKNMSRRAAEMLKEEMDYMGPVRISDVKAAQEKIADIVEKLETSGEIIIPLANEEELVV
ncbi:FliG C-terminal domain-containing protein [Treponema sp. R80B11-R83G3]